MKISNFSFLSAFLVFLLSCGNDDSSNPISCLTTDSLATFQANDSLVIIEAESTTLSGDWNLESTTEGFTGSGYLQWEGANQFNNPGEGILTWLIAIYEPGTYRFQWRSRINEGDDATESNDAWLRFQDASDFYGEKSDGSRVYPVGSGKSPNPEGASSENWLKIYQSQLGRWSWQARTSDNDPHDIYVVFDSPGLYQMEVSGRSTGFALDRMVLYNTQTTESNATDEALTQNPQGCD